MDGRPMELTTVGMVFGAVLRSLLWFAVAYGLVNHAPEPWSIIAAGIIAADIVTWLMIRFLELPGQLWAFNLEAVLNLVLVLVLVDVTGFFDAFGEPEQWVFGIMPFLLVSFGKFSWWLLNTFVDI